jgi:glutathione peroxidase
MKIELWSGLRVLGVVGWISSGLWVSASQRGQAAPAPVSGVELSLFEIPLTTVEGKKTTLKAYKNQVLLIVNTASHCGYTPQYAGLEKLYQKYKGRGLVVLGFPSNDFGRQEPGNNSQIKLFCKSNYEVDFPLFDKAPVGGDQIQPLYTFLLRNAEDHSAVQWNFEKFLVGRDGKVIGRFRSRVTPESPELIESLERALSEVAGPSQLHGNK